MAKSQTNNVGVGPLAHPEIATRIQEADKSQRYLIAVWSLTDDPDGEELADGGIAMRLNYTMITNGFPSLDLPTALAMFTDSISDFQLQALKQSGDVIRNAETVGEEKMQGRPSGVVSKKRRRKKAQGQKPLTLRKPKGKKK
jgi:hypothetical protein